MTKSRKTSDLVNAVLVDNNNNVTLYNAAISGTLSVTGSLFATSSQAITASYAHYAVSASHEIIKEESSSFADTASYVNPLVQNVIITGSLLFGGQYGGTIQASNRGVNLYIGYNTIFGGGSGTDTAAFIVLRDAFSSQRNTRIKSDQNIYIGTKNSAGKTFIGGDGSGLETLSAKLQVKGSGTTSATTAFRVENANTSGSLIVRDDQVIILSGDTTVAPGTLPGGYFIRDTYDGRSTYVLQIGETIGNDLFVGANAASSYFLSRQANRKVRIGHYSTGTADVEIGYNGTTNNIVNLRPAYFASGSYITGSVAITGSAGTGSALQVYKSGSTVVSIQGSQGELFSITDSLSGSLFSVSNISGLPILEVFSDNTTLMGDYLAPALMTTKRLTVNSGSTVIYSIPTASYDGAFFEYTIKSGSNARAGQIFSTYLDTTASYADNSTSDIGDTTGFIFGVILSGSNMVLTGSASTDAWTVKTIIRSI